MAVSRVQLHPDGPEFSRIVLGLWRLVDEPAYTPQQTLTLVEKCVEQGITTLDEADIYGNYGSEEAFGKALSLKPSLRDQVEIVSKCGIKLVSENRPSHGIKMYDTSTSHIIQSVENSLKAMKTDRLDLLLIHRPDPLMDPDQVAKAFDKLKGDGKVLHFGVSNFTVRQFELLQSRLYYPLVTNQIEISVLCHDAFFDGNLDYCMEKRIAPMAWSPYGGGKLFTGSGDQENRLHQVFVEIGEKYDHATPDQLALAWLFRHPAHILGILGTRKTERIHSAVVADHIKLSREDWFRIWVAAQGKDVP